jgi:hypothetical protein
MYELCSRGHICVAAMLSFALMYQEEEKVRFVQEIDPIVHMSMEEPKTWRELLGLVISDPRQRLRVAEVVGVNPVTLIRWVNYKSNPRPDNIRSLLIALSKYYQPLATQLITAEYADIMDDVPLRTDIAPEIPSAFYARVLNAHTSSPPLLRGSSVSILILQQLLEHLDPQQVGMVAIVAQCTPALSRRKVYSLRKTYSRGNPPWGNIEQRTFFLGVESQVGRALVAGRFTAVQTQEERARLFPMHNYTVEGQSAIAYPILLADRAAGCLGIACTRRNYFTQLHMDLIQHYVDLLVLAFEEREFYPLHDIELGIMPPASGQRPILASFQRRVTGRIIDASLKREPLTRLQAEQEVWQEIEGELLRIPFLNGSS